MLATQFSHLDIWQLLHGRKFGEGAVSSSLYVTCWSVCDQDWPVKSVLDWSLDLSPWSLDFFDGSKVKLQPCVLDLLIFAVERSLIPWSAHKKSFDCLIPEFLIPVTNTATQDRKWTWTSLVFISNYCDEGRSLHEVYSIHLINLHL